ncbi:MAG TPA: hypothetical protein VKU60_19950 [Chloroflexota bacterium]|nr:hypothetical protein [Chloroflexota bacterium]
MTATKELSKLGFLRWLVEHGRHPEFRDGLPPRRDEPDEHEIARWEWEGGLAA